MILLSEAIRSIEKPKQIREYINLYFINTLKTYDRKLVQKEILETINKIYDEKQRKRWQRQAKLYFGNEYIG